MRRIIHNSTAIAACLSLLAPHVALAQAPAIPETQQEPAATDPAQAAPATEAETQPEAGGEPAEATCEDGTAPPCAPAADATAPEAEPVTEAPAAETAEPAAEAPASDAQAETAPQPDAQAQPDPETQDAASEPQAQPDAPSGEPEPEAAAEPAAETDAQAPAEPDAPMDEDALADALAKDAATQEQPQQEAAPAETPEAEADPAMTGSAEAEADPAEAQASPAEADAAATDDAAPADQAAESDANAEPETEAQGATEVESDAQPADAQPQSQSQETPDQPRAPEEGVAETEAAREAAEASETPAAAALSDETGDADLREEQITEENSRSSDEDFATSLRDALGAATGQPQPAAEAGDDDDNDLAKALLLGLGGLAVGAMLTNNRQVALSAPDRVVVTRPDGSQQVIKDEVALLRQPGATVTTEDFDDGSSRTIVTRADGSKVVTIRDADLRVLRRTLVTADGSSIPLIDDTADVQPVDIAGLPAPADLSSATGTGMDEDALRAALLRESSFDRRFTLAQIRNIPQVRALVAPVNIDAITFDTGSAAISPDQARSLSSLGKVIRDAVASNPREIFLIEGHTDTVGSDPANLALSDRRAESVALALTEYFEVPPENMVVQGYGEQFLAVRSEGDIRENRRASVRRISDLLQTAAR